MHRLRVRLISPSTQATTSTGEVSVQSGKKKRGPTNPNNLLKPSSGLTTARNLCGTEGQARRKTGTVAEFTTHCNSLTAQQSPTPLARSLSTLLRQMLPNSQLAVPAHNSPALVSLSSSLTWSGVSKRDHYHGLPRSSTSNFRGLCSYSLIFYSRDRDWW
ncbi:hypothetical protein DEU56DRAFT_820296 [Suillus clintonianus]|uniref:uncharacterized protein n=1 Tax=Suillus clintonianus TaxID=1904413 RepID=UPI001B866F7C|nr:uncharacterized protein DEU56DRAFT_820296 [Suillus clintonianus]KAG2127485.1 hypothetical protein DEU56DRAFT_820296 [Suillus clintonianus]